MGCYGIGVSRLVATAVEQFNDADGIFWPLSIAPYHVHIAQLGAEPEVVEAVATLERELEARGVEVLVDDREERPGVKFKDADLIGIPLRLTVGARSLAKGGVELKPRTEKDPKKAELLPLESGRRTHRGPSRRAVVRVMSDKRRFASSTEAVHAGTDRKRPHHTLASSIAQTATFTFDDTADLERYMRGEDPDPEREEYGRYGNPTVSEVERRVATFEGADDAVAFTSGMASNLHGRTGAAQVRRPRGAVS